MKTLVIKVQLCESLYQKGYPMQIIVENTHEKDDVFGDTRHPIADCKIRLVEEHSFCQSERRGNCNHNADDFLYEGHGHVRTIESRKNPRNQY